MDKFLSRPKSKKQNDADAVESLHVDFTRSCLASQAEEHSKIVSKKDEEIAMLRKQLEEKTILHHEEEQLRKKAEIEALVLVSISNYVIFNFQSYTHSLIGLMT